MLKRTKTLTPVFFILIASLSGVSAQADLNNSIYVPVEPCRAGDTRGTGTAKITAGSNVEWLAYGDDMSTQGGAGSPGCPQPKTDMKPIGVALNVTVVGNQATGNGNVVAYPADGAIPSGSLVNYKPGTNIANSTIAGLCQDGVCDGKFKLQSNISDVPVIADVQGYFYPSPGNVANVALSGGDYTSPVDAMADVANWCGTPSTTNRCLVKIAPGIYTVTEGVVMQEWVSIQGSGQEATKITGAVSTGVVDFTSSAVVLGMINTSLTDLTIENTGGGDTSIAIFNFNAAPLIERVTATASGATTGYGVYNEASSLSMTNVTATASCEGASYGVYNKFSSSPTMTNVTATGSSLSNSYGVYNWYSLSPTMTNVTATGSGLGSGGLNTYGVFNEGSSPTMTNVTATGSGGSNKNYGVYIGSSSPRIKNSSIEGNTVGMLIDGPSTGARVVNSKIIGGVSDLANTTTNCLGNYDENLVDVTC